MPIAVPANVETTINGQDIKVKGPQGELAWTLPAGISLSKEENVLTVVRSSDEKQQRAYHGLSRALLANMVNGVSTGFEKHLDIIGVGYKAALKGKDIDMAIGFSHPVLIKCPDGITFEVPQPTRIIIKGIDKQLVGETAAKIRQIRPPEPYKGKGIKYVEEVIRRKAGKAGK